MVSKSILAATLACFAAGVESVPTQTCPPLDPNVPEDALAAWVCEGIFKFAPWVPGWQDAFPVYFNQDLRASFNTTQYDYDGLFAFFTAAQQGGADTYTDFGTNLTSIVASTNKANPKEGVVDLQGVEGGYFKATGEYKVYPNAVYAVVNVVDGAQKIVEWRELNNVP